MAHDDDWSDSDDEVFSDSETPVQLGLPDGPIHSSTDLLDAAVSRIGGHPVRDIFCRPSVLRKLNTFVFSHLVARRSLLKSLPSTAPSALTVLIRWNYCSKYGVP